MNFWDENVCHFLPKITLLSFFLISDMLSFVPDTLSNTSFQQKLFWPQTKAADFHYKQCLVSKWLILSKNDNTVNLKSEKKLHFCLVFAEC